MTLTVFSDPRMTDHQPGLGHPERPDRLTTLLDRLADDPDHRDRPLISAPPAPLEALEAVHTTAHVERTLAYRGRDVNVDPDTRTSPASIDAALLAAGQAIAATDHTLDHGEPAFALGRPPGHHAESDRAMGFCFFNNIAIAAAHALRRDDVDRVLIVDWDVHHGNGTQEIFYDSPNVFFFSTHQSPLYPGTGAASETGTGPGRGTTRNVPLPAGAGDDALLDAFHNFLTPAATDFRPDLLLISAGYDAHHRDPLGGMTVTTDGFARLTKILRHLANDLCHGRMAFILEGGYDLTALSDSVSATILATD